MIAPRRVFCFINVTLAKISNKNIVGNPDIHFLSKNIIQYQRRYSSFVQNGQKRHFLSVRFFRVVITDNPSVNYYVTDES